MEMKRWRSTIPEGGIRMNLSIYRALEVLKEKELDLDENDLGFVLTVMRDNSTDDIVHNLLKSFLKKMD
jgi:hypothetical protein